MKKLIIFICAMLLVGLGYSQSIEKYIVLQDSIVDSSGSTYMKFASAGIGIGTDVPTEALEVVGNVSLTPDTIFTIGDTYDSLLLVFTTQVRLGKIYGNVSSLYSSGMGIKLIGGSCGDQIMTVNTVGYFVGYHTTYIEFTSTADCDDYTSVIIPYEEDISEGSLFAEGKIGIGTTPTVELDVVGDGNISGNFYVGDSLAIGTDAPAYPLDVNGDAHFNSDTVIFEKIVFDGTIYTGEGNGRGEFIVDASFGDVSTELSGDYTIVGGIYDGETQSAIYVLFNGINTIVLAYWDYTGVTALEVGSLIYQVPKVGIGTTSPTVALDVVGSGAFTGNLDVDDTLTAHVLRGEIGHISADYADLDTIVMNGDTITSISGGSGQWDDPVSGKITPTTATSAEIDTIGLGDAGVTTGTLLLHHSVDAGYTIKLSSNYGRLTTTASELVFYTSTLFPGISVGSTPPSSGNAYFRNIQSTNTGVGGADSVELIVSGATILAASTRGVTIDSVLNLIPCATPSSPSEGDIYSNSTDHHLYFYNGTGWVQLDN